MVRPHGKNDIVSSLRFCRAVVRPSLPASSPPVSLSLSAKEDKVGLPLAGLGHPFSSISVLIGPCRSHPLSVMGQTDIATVL